MLDRTTGKVLHIDFGDCFEVAMQRDKFPEKVPFRLTRMLVNAMEVSGIEGNFRLTCEKVMAILRENKDSVIATLEAFVHDPLVSWRLQDIAKDKDVTVDSTRIEAQVQRADIAGEQPNVDPTNVESKAVKLEQANPQPLSRSSKHASRLRTLPTLPENDDVAQEDPKDAAQQAEESRVSQQQEEQEVSPEPFENLHHEMQHLSSSAAGDGISFSINLRNSFSERSFANRRREMTFSHQSDEPAADRAVLVIRRINDKLTGLDFANRTPYARLVHADALDVPEQVDRLIIQATSNENLCLSFFGWCPFW